MQIQQLSHLRFPTEQRSGSIREDIVDAEVGPDSPTLPGKETKPENASVLNSAAVLHIGRKEDGPALYSRPSQSKASSRGQSDSQDLPDRCQDRRMPATPTAHALKVDKDGILVARPRSAFSTQQSDFVALAVSAMRDFRDTAEQAKTSQAAGASALPAPSSLLRGGLAQLAERLKALT